MKQGKAKAEADKLAKESGATVTEVVEEEKKSDDAKKVTEEAKKPEIK